MTTRRATQPDPTISRGPGRPWPPTCTICGWTGTPTAHASPYIGCCGDRSRHQRNPTVETTP